MVLNRYPWWKNVIIALVVLVAFLYSAPNLFGEDPALQILGANSNVTVDKNTIDLVGKTLQSAQIGYRSFEFENNNLLIRFPSAEAQLAAKDVIQKALGDTYLVALNLAPATPAWLHALGGIPMKLGLDLRGGVYLLLQVDVDSVVKQRIEGDLRSISQVLRENHIRYADIQRENAGALSIKFRDVNTLDAAEKFLVKNFGQFQWVRSDKDNNFMLVGSLSPSMVQDAKQETLEQEMNILRNRVNELGISEAVVQQQGATRVSVEMPGIQNTAEAKNILGKAATLEFHMVDTDHDPNSIVGGIAPPNTHLYRDQRGQPVLLKNEIILHGSSITSARSGFGEDGRPSVDVRLGGGGEGLFSKVTMENIGKPMAVLYVEVKSEPKEVNGQKTIVYSYDRHVISVATIISGLGNNFSVTGLSNQEEARTLALLLRAGALPAPVTIIEERQVGPSLGKQNIHMGILSVVVGFCLVVFFMALYYRFMGIIADLALAMNLVLIVAVLSLLGATLTLPGIAGIVLTVGMAVDANVLIFERIREELRNGNGIQASIHAGYERAFSTIVDSNMTLLIVAIVLFSLGSGPVKGFAVTLTIGLITSMFTAITGTRAIVNYIYGGRAVKKISIGL